MDDSSDQDAFQPVAAVLAFLIPGAGHAFMGHVGRGACIFAGCFGLFGGGLYIAGLGAVDSGLIVSNAVKSLTGSPPVKVADGEPIWFLGTMFVGPAAFIIDNIHQHSFKVREITHGRDNKGNPVTSEELRAARPNEGRGPDGLIIPGGTPPNRRALGRSAEIGTLYCTVAGLLNLIAIIDISHSRRRVKARPE